MHPSGGTIRSGKAVLDELREISPTLQAHLSEDAGDVVFGGIEADAELGGDLGVRAAPEHERQDLSLLRRENYARTAKQQQAPSTKVQNPLNAGRKTGPFADSPPHHALRGFFTTPSPPTDPHSSETSAYPGFGEPRSR